MASGQTLCSFKPADNEPPSSNPATPDIVNQEPVLNFDATTQETAVFTLFMPLNYAGGGITVSIKSAMASATSGTLGWLVAIERKLDGTDTILSDGFAADQTITATTVPGTAGIYQTLTVAISNGANMDSVAAGEQFRLRLRRDVANDTATGDGRFVGGSIKET